MTKNICCALGGKFDCCYANSIDQSPLISSNNAIVRGAGYHYLNKIEDNVMKQRCCLDSSTNFFCSLFTAVRSATSSSSYRTPNFSKLNLRHSKKTNSKIEQILF